MDRRGFLQTTGLGAVAVLVSRSDEPVMAADTKNSATIKQLPKRSDVPVADTWDLSSLFPNDKAWEDAFVAWQKQIEGFKTFQGKLAESPKTLAACLKFNLDIEQAGERLETFALLKSAEDQSNSEYQRMVGRCTQAASLAAQASSFIDPEILAIPTAKMNEFLLAPELEPYKLLLTRILRVKPHTLSEKEEKLLAMQTEMAGSPTKIFRQLNDTDLKFGTVKNEKGEVIQLSHGAFLSLLNSPDNNVRATAFHTFYEQYTAHQRTLAATLSAAVERDVYYARARNYASSLESALFPDEIPVSVYDNLLSSVHKQLPALHRYYDVRRRALKLKEIHHYDNYVSIIPQMQTNYSFDEAIEMVVAGLKPLGEQYCGTLKQGLKNRWCDRYENLGKQSGAFSCGSFGSNPYILVNYQPNVLDDVFTLAHEGGHSMHSYYSSKNQPFAYYNYSYFVAEVASTFNEMLLGKYLLGRAKDKREHAYLLSMIIDTIRNTIFRQTMFAEFEKLTHASVESGEPLTVDRLKEMYHALLVLYFGPKFTLDPELDIECLRIPHFYRNFYVYKYATSMSAAMALSERVTQGGPAELNDYLTFLKGGCSKSSLDLLRGAGIDMEKPDGVDQALVQFDKYVTELDKLI